MLMDEFKTVLDNNRSGVVIIYQFVKLLATVELVESAKNTTRPSVLNQRCGFKYIFSLGFGLVRYF